MSRYIIYSIICISLVSFSGFVILQDPLTTSRFLIKEKPDHTQSSYKREFLQKGMKFRAKLPRTAIEVWERPKSSRSAEDDLAALQAAYPNLHIEMEHTYQLTRFPNDPLFSKQTHLHNTGQDACEAGTDIGAIQAWEQHTGDNTMIIAVIDGGMEINHEDLKDNLWTNQAEVPGNGIDDDENGYIDDIHGWDFANNDPAPEDSTGHGTHVAGIIAARGNNGKGVTGVCWNCKILPLKFTDHTGRGSTSSAIKAIEYAIYLKERGENIIAINNSWGGGGMSLLLKESIARADSAGIIFVAAAGNDASSNDRTPFYPASFEVPNVISVTATDCRGALASFSNYGQYSVDIATTGDAVYSTLPRNEYGYMSGTSMAAPQVAGAIALMRQRFPNEGHIEIRRKLLERGEIDQRLQGKSGRGEKLDIGSAMEERGFWEQYMGQLQIRTMAKIHDTIWVGGETGLMKYELASGALTLFTKDNSSLPSNSIRDIEISADSSLWIATTGGLVKLKGSTWQVYRTQNSDIPDNSIFALEVDSDGTGIWVGMTSAGLAHFDGIRWESYRVPDSFNEVNTLEMTYDGSLWVGTNTNGFAKFDGENWGEVFNTNNSPLAYNSIAKLAEGPDSSLWISTFGQLLNYKNSEWQIWDPTDYLPNISSVNFLDVTSKGDIWMSAGGSLLQHYISLVSYTNGEWNAYTYEDLELPLYHWDGISDMLSDSDGNLWFATQKGIIKHHDLKWELINNELTFPGSQINDFSVDSKENLWVVTLKEVNINNGHSWETITPSNTINSSMWASTITSNDYVWVTSENGLLRFKGHEQIVFNTSNSSIPENRITSVVSDSDDLVWMTTEGDKLVSYNYKNDHWTTFNPPDSIPLASHLPMDVDPEGNIWISTIDRLIKFDKVSSWTIYDSSNSPLPAGKLSAFTVDKSGTIWVGTQNEGLIYYDQGQWGNIRLNFLTNAWIDCFETDRKGNLWVGTTKGLFKYDGTNWVIYDENNSQLPSRIISALAMSPNDDILWVGTLPPGVVKFIPDSTASFSLLNTHICLGDTASFQVNGLLGDSLEWEIDGQLVSTAQNLNYFFPNPGKYKVELNVYTDVDTASYFAYINVEQPVAVDLGKDTLALTNSVRLSVDLPNVVGYNWMNVEGDTLGTDPHFSVYEDGTYILSVQDQCGFTSADTIKVDFIGNGLYILPGDVNGDGAINALDILLMSPVHGTVGTIRTPCDNPPCDWSQPQLSTPWGAFFDDGLAQGTDFMHADTDGDGEVDIFLDAEVTRNYANSSHPPYHAPNSSSEVQIYLELDQREVSIGQEIGFQVYVDGPEDMLDDIHGIALGIDINIPLINDPTLDTEPSLLGTPDEDMYQTYIYDQAAKHIDFVFTKIGGEDNNPNIHARRVGRGGTIAVIEDIDTTRMQSNQFPLTLTLGNIATLNKKGEVIPVNPISIQRTHNVMVNIPTDMAIIRFVSFQAECKEDLKRLNWTVWEKNIAWYELEKSEDGQNFQTVETIMGNAHASAEKHAYEWTVENDDEKYYRVKIVGRNGEIYYSEPLPTETCGVSTTISNENEQLLALEIYPNPTDGKITLEILPQKSSDLQIDIFDLKGKRVQTQNRRLGVGKQQLELRLSELPDGLYLIRGSMQEGVFTEKIVIR